jgi:hypothetical protein
MKRKIYVESAEHDDGRWLVSVYGQGHSMVLTPAEARLEADAWELDQPGTPLPASIRKAADRCDRKGHDA